MREMSEYMLQQDCSEFVRCPFPWDRLKDKRILITGGTGFIGRYLTRTLCWLNHQLSLNLELGLLHRSGTPPFYDPCVRWIRGDIDRDFISEDFTPNIIVHAASPANQQAISTDSVGIVKCNVLATHYLLEKARENDATFLFFSSGEVYQRQQGKIPEIDVETLSKNSRLSLYGNGKLSGEILCREYHRKYGLDYRILRLFSIFGPGESLLSGRSFTDFLRQAIETNTIQVTGPGTQIRSYCYLSDFISGLLYVLLEGENTVYNIGNEDNICTIFELAKHIAEVHGGVDVIGPLSQSTAADSFVSDTSKLRKLGWQPQVDLQACIKRCLDSYQKGGTK